MAMMIIRMTMTVMIVNLTKDDDDDEGNDDHKKDDDDDDEGDRSKLYQYLHTTAVTILSGRLFLRDPHLHHHHHHQHHHYYHHHHQIHIKYGHVFYIFVNTPHPPPFKHLFLSSPCPPPTSNNCLQKGQIWFLLQSCHIYTCLLT